MDKKRVPLPALDDNRDFFPRRRDLGDALQKALNEQGIEVKVRSFKQDRRTGIRHTFILGAEPQVIAAVKFCRDNFSPIEITYQHTPQ